MLKSFVAALALVAAISATAVTVTYGAGPDYAGATVSETFDAHAAADATQSFTDTIGGIGFTSIDVNVGNYSYGNGTNYAGAYVGVGIASAGS